MNCCQKLQTDPLLDYHLSIVSTAFGYQFSTTLRLTSINLSMNFDLKSTPWDYTRRYEL